MMEDRYEPPNPPFVPFTALTATSRRGLLPVTQFFSKSRGISRIISAGELTGEELAKLKDYIAGQASDGFGEGVEQHEITVGKQEFYAHLWNFEDWSIQTEQERFSQKYAEGLPELCFSTLPSTGALICIKRGESGYYPSDWNTPDCAQNRQIADEQNQRLGVCDCCCLFTL